MREIKFKGKRVDKGEWAYGYLFSYGINSFIVGEKDFICYENNSTAPTICELRTFGNRVIPETVGQYIGLKDKNGVEIYEGDILRCDCHEGGFCATVEFGNPNAFYSWGWQIKPINKTNFNSDILLWVETELDHVTCEIIGNKTDNPELMEVQKDG